MKSCRFVFLVCLIMALASGAWRQLGPEGVSVRAMSNVPGYPDELFIITGGFPSYICWTGNAGQTWTVRETIPDRLNALTVNPLNVRTMFAGGNTGKVYRSTNSGYTWSVVATLPSGVQIQQLAVNAENGAEIWALAEIAAGDSVGLGFYRSTDGGANWQGRGVVWSYAVQARALAVVPGDSGWALIGGSVANRARLFLTTDGGSSWADRSVGLAGSSVYGGAFVPTGSGVIVCATDSGIFRSTDLGVTWTRRLSAPAYSIVFAPLSPYYGYAGGENLVFRSTDLGLSWRTDTVSVFTGTETRFIAVNPNSPLELYAGNGFGVFYSYNGGYNWINRSSGFRQLDVSFLKFYRAETLFAGITGYGIVQSNDGGQGWELWGRMFPGSGWVRGLAVNPRHPDTVICVTGWDSKLHLTINRGDSWETFTVVSHFEPMGVDYHPRGPDTVYVWGGKRDSVSGPLRFAIYRSTDRGQHWTPVLVRNEGWCQGMIFSGTGDTLIAYGKDGSGPAVLRSTDRGRNWISLTNGISGASVADLKLVPGSSEQWLCATPAGVFRTQNSGSYWSRLGLQGVTCVLPDTMNPNVIWAGTDTQGFYYTTNQGVSWWRDTLGIAGRSVSFLVFNPFRRSAVYAGITGHSLLGRNVIGIGETGQERFPEMELGVLPTAVRKICRIIVPPGTERIEVFDPAGRKRAEIPVSGRKEVCWSIPGELNSGVYLLVLRRAQERTVRKVLFLP